MSNPHLSKFTSTNSAVLIIDVQEKLFPHVEHACDVMERIQLLVKGVRLLDIPVFVTEQYPKGLGSTIKPLKDLVGEAGQYPSKTCFSSLGDAPTKKAIQALGKKQFIVTGIEAHVCVLQTVKDLILEGYEVVVVNDAISSRSIYDFSSAIAEMRDMGARIVSTETILFELFNDASNPQFKSLSALLK